MTITIMAGRNAHGQETVDRGYQPPQNRFENPNPCPRGGTVASIRIIYSEENIHFGPAEGRSEVSFYYESPQK